MELYLKGEFNPYDESVLIEDKEVSDIYTEEIIKNIIQEKEVVKKERPKNSFKSHKKSTLKFLNGILSIIRRAV